MYIFNIFCSPNVAVSYNFVVKDSALWTFSKGLTIIAIFYLFGLNPNPKLNLFIPKHTLTVTTLWNFVKKTQKTIYFITKISWKKLIKSIYINAKGGKIIQISEICEKELKKRYLLLERMRKIVQFVNIIWRKILRFYL